MIVGSRTFLRLNKQNPLLLQSSAFRGYSSAEYTTVDQATHVLANPVAFQGDKAAVFDSTGSNERRFVPFEIKELSFKCGMGFMGVMVWDYMYKLGFTGEVAAAAFVLNWAYRSFTIMSSTIRKVELHQDGKTVTITPRMGSPWDCKISDVAKMEHEKKLVQTFEEAYLYPIEISGKKWFLHGQGQEAIKHGEAFRCIINGQSIKL